MEDRQRAVSRGGGLTAWWRDSVFAFGQCWAGLGLLVFGRELEAQVDPPVLHLQGGQDEQR